MGHNLIRLPELNILKEQLLDEYWIIYYQKLDLMTGSMESMNYLLEFFKKD